MLKSYFMTAILSLAFSNLSYGMSKTPNQQDDNKPTPQSATPTPTASANVTDKRHLPPPIPKGAKTNWDLDVTNDGVKDKVVWSKTQEQLDQFTVKVGPEFKNEIKLATLSPKESFCGDLKIKPAKKPGLANRDYFNSESTEEKRELERVEYTTNPIVEISYAISAEPGTWSDPCYCTTGYIYKKNEFKEAGVACD